MKRILFAFLLFLIFQICLFGGRLFDSSIVLSKQGQDVHREYLFLREFGFKELKKGNFPFWNPYYYSGTPFFAETQTALFYPPNWIHLFLEPTLAINLVFVMHLVFGGLGMFLWTSQRGLSFISSIISGFTFMLSGPVFLHLYAGHLSNVSAIAWIPFMMWMVEKIFERICYRNFLFGVLIISAQILSGHMQYVFFTAVGVILFAVILSMTKKKLKPLGVLGGMYLIAILFTAVQLLPSLSAVQLSNRSGGMPFEDAKQFYFPIENLITFILPGLWGNDLDLAYWGRWAFWESNFFIGITGFTFLVLGIFYGFKKKVTIVYIPIILFLISLGDSTPLYYFLYHFFPPFHLFRGISKMNGVTVAFVALFVGYGCEVIKNDRFLKLPFFCGAVIFLNLIVFLAVSLSGMMGSELWKQFVDWRISFPFTKEILKINSPFYFLSAEFSMREILLTLSFLFSLTLGFFFYRKYDFFKMILFFLVILELFIFAKKYGVSFEVDPDPGMTIHHMFPNLQDKRYFLMHSLEQHRYHGFYNAKGKMPWKDERYALFEKKFLTDPILEKGVGLMHPYTSVFEMLRIRYFFSKERSTSFGAIKEVLKPMERAHWISSWKILPNDQIWDELIRPGFDPRKCVLLEEDPELVVSGSNHSPYLKLKDGSSDEFELEVNTDSDGILLITDAYHRDWKAYSEDHNLEFKILRANDVLRAIPLRKGSYHIRLEYVPKYFYLGKWLSLLTLIGLMGVVILWVVRAFAVEAFQTNRTVIQYS